MISGRNVGLLVVAILAAVICVRLGFWQLSVARDDGRRDAIAASEAMAQVDLAEYVAPHQPFPADASNRRVTVTGTYDPAGQVLIVGHRLGERLGSWVVTPLIVDGTGARVPVLRGFTTADAVPAPATTKVTVTGTIGPGESPQPRTPSMRPDQLPAMDLAVLVNRWGGEIYNLVVLASAEAPDLSTAADGDLLTRVPPPQIDGGLRLVNAAYAVQWWLFAAFALFMWWKMIREPRGRPEGEARARIPDESRIA